MNDLNLNMFLMAFYKVWNNWGQSKNKCAIICKLQIESIVNGKISSG